MSIENAIDAFETKMSYLEYARETLENYSKLTEKETGVLVNAVDDFAAENVLDIGCGAGLEMIPFVRKRGSNCIGIDIGRELSFARSAIYEMIPEKGKLNFVQAAGEKIPFPDRSFDIVICRVALPYMQNRQAVGEAARVLRPGGAYLLKIHSFSFYVHLLRRRLRSGNAKLVAYPLISIAGGIWHSLTGHQMAGTFWKEKEIYQSRRFLRRELKKNGLIIKQTLADSSSQAPSFLIVKEF